MKPRKLVWTPGLFVTQHHFQQLDRYHEWRVDERLRHALAYPWGVVDIEIDEHALASEQFKINRIVAILPDGSLIEHGEAIGDPIAPRSFASVFTPQVPALSVYVALAPQVDDMPNVDLDARERRDVGGLRYVRDQTTVVDTNTGTGEHTVQFARPNVALLFGNEREGAFVAVRVAQIVRAATGVPVLRESLIPPALRVGASPYLVARFRRLLSTMNAKQRSLAESRRQRPGAAIEFPPNEIAKLWLLQALNANIPAIAHVVDHETVHPEQAYIELARFIGQLCTFAVDGDPTTIPKFNFLEMGDVFEPMFERAHKWLDAATPERYVEIPLQKRADGMCLGRIVDANLLRSTFFLAASGAGPEAQLRERLPALTKIASWGQIGEILHTALSGIKLELEFSPPSALPIRPGVAFFRVDRTPKFWNDIAATGTIAIYHPLDPRPELRLYAVEPANLP
ncbi:MAG: type VI secretion system baseplate subunit TssK [Polyangiaceae bacterium]